VRDADIFLAPTAGGEPRRLSYDDTGIGGLDWTPDGAYIVFSSYRQGEGNRLLKISAAGGQPEPLPLPRRFYELLSLARHGRRLLFAQLEGNVNIWRYEILPTAAQSRPPTKLIASTGFNVSPQFSPDGKRVAFLSTRSGSPEVWLCESDGSNPRRLTFFDDPDGQITRPHWSPEGREIVFTKGDAVYVVNAEGGQPRRVATGASGVAYPSWSRNGKWIYFGSENERDYTWQVWKVPAEGGHEVQVTKKHGFAALESPDGKTLFYDKNMGPPDFLVNGGLWKVPVEGGEETLVFRELYAGESGLWDLTGEGIYFNHADAIKFYNFATRRITQVAKPELPKPPRGLAVSPDGRWILLTQMDIQTSHIMLIENFRW